MLIARNMWCVHWICLVLKIKISTNLRFCDIVFVFKCFFCRDYENPTRWPWRSSPASSGIRSWVHPCPKKRSVGQCNSGPTLLTYDKSSPDEQERACICTLTHLVRRQPKYINNHRQQQDNVQHVFTPGSLTPPRLLANGIRYSVMISPSSPHSIEASTNLPLSKPPIGPYPIHSKWILPYYTYSTRHVDGLDIWVAAMHYRSKVFRATNVI